MVAVVAGLAMSAMGQWSTDPANNLKVADLANDQVQPKIQPTPDGGCYIAWFDNRTGGNDVYLQRLNAQGVEQWPHNGVLLCDRSFSSTVDYDMIVDSAGNALVAYNDNSGGSDQISVSKVDPAGTIVWKTTVTSDAVGHANPHICQLSKGSYIVGYSNFASPQNWIAQKLDVNGAPQWAAPGITISEAGHYEALSDIKPAGAGFVAMWVRGSGTSASTSSKGLYLQKYDATGVAQWNAGAPTIAFAGNSGASIQNGYFPTMRADGAGGVVIGWYEISGSRNAYIQHVLADGSLKFAAPVANTGVTAGRMRIGAGLAYKTTTGEYFLCSTDSSSPSQGNYGVIAQKFDSTGARLWTDAGATVLAPNAGGQPSLEQCQLNGSGCTVLFMDTRSPTTRIIDSAGLNGAGSVVWHNLVNSDSGTDKSRLASALSTSGGAMLTYGWGGTGGTDIAAANINADGSLGPPPPACYPNCDGSTVSPVLTANDFQCFLNKFAAADPTANCDGSTAVPTLTANDFQCFLNAYATGCI